MKVVNIIYTKFIFVNVCTIFKEVTKFEFFFVYCIAHSNYFQALFENPDFEVDSTAEEYRLLNPVLSRLDKNKARAKRQEFEVIEVCVSLTYFIIHCSYVITVNHYLL